MIFTLLLPGSKYLSLNSICLAYINIKKEIMSGLWKSRFDVLLSRICGF